MNQDEYTLISVELSPQTWLFVQNVLMSLKRSAEQPPRKGEHRSHTLRLIDRTPNALHLLHDAYYSIAQALIVEWPGPRDLP